MRLQPSLLLGLRLPSQHGHEARVATLGRKPLHFWDIQQRLEACEASHEETRPHQRPPRGLRRIRQFQLGLRPSQDARERQQITANANAALLDKHDERPHERHGPRPSSLTEPGLLEQNCSKLRTFQKFNSEQPEDGCETPDVGIFPKGRAHGKQPVLDQQPARQQLQEHS